MAVTYLRLFDPTQQFQLKNGAINVAGLLKVKLEGTDDYAPVFDEDGTQLAQPVILDNNGRSKGLFVDASKVYWLEVDDRDGYELFAIRKMAPCGGGSGSALGSTFEVVSSDGTVSVERYDDGGITYFDLSTALTNQAATWGATFATANAVSGDDNWEMLPVVTSAGTSQWNNGWTASKDCVADLAASLEMDGDSSAISTVDVMCVFSVDGVGVSTEYSQLDPSESRGKVSFEYKGSLLEGQVVDCRIFVKSVEAMAPALVAKSYFNEECDGIIGGGEGGGEYSAGSYVEITENRVINVTGLQPQSAMGSYVEKSAISAQSSQWNDVSSRIPWSALSGDGTKITGISSSAIGGTDYSAGEYVSITGDTISVTGLQPVSAMSSYVEKTAFDACCTAMSGYVSSLSSQVSSISSTVSGLTGTYVEISSISGYSSIWNSASAVPNKLDESAFTAYTSTAREFTGVTTDSTLTGNGMPGSALGVNRMELVFDSSMNTSVSGNSAIVGVGTAITSGFIPTSESGAFQPSGNYVSSSDMSGYIPTSESANYVLTSQSGAFQPSGNYVSSSDMSGYVDASSISAASSVWNSASAISSLIPWSSLEGDGTSITAISGSAIGGGGTGGKTYSGIAPVIVDNDADTISLSSRELVFSSPLSAVDSGNSAIVSIDLSAYALSSDVSGVIDTVSTNSASWGGGATGDYVDKSAMEVTIGDANTAVETAFAQGSANSAQRFAFVQGRKHSAWLCSMAQGSKNLASSWSMAQGVESTAILDSLAQGTWNSAEDNSFAQGGRNSASGSSMAQGYYNSAFNLSFAQGRYLSAINMAAVFGTNNLRGDGDTATGDSAAFVIGDGWLSSTGRHDLMVVTKNGEITMFSSTADTTGTGIMSSLRHISANYQPSGDYIYASSLGTGTI